MRSEVDVSKWSGEGTFTQLLIDCLRSMDAIEFVRVEDRKSTRLNSSHSQISYAVFCLKKKKKNNREITPYLRSPKPSHQPHFHIRYNIRLQPLVLTNHPTTPLNTSITTPFSPTQCTQ